MERILETPDIESQHTDQQSRIANILIPLSSVILLFVLCNFTDFSFQESLALSTTFYNLIIYIYTLGKYINIPELTLSVFSFELLFMPVVAYNYRPSDMDIDPISYFNFAIPAIIAMSIGYKVLDANNKFHFTLLIRAKEYIEKNNNMTYKFFYIGLIAYFMELIVPTSLKQIFTLFSNCLYISVLYNYMAGKKRRLMIPIAVVSLMLLQTVRTGMFGHIFMWAVVWFPFMLINTRFGKSMFSKTVFVMVIFTFLPILQSVKYQYRIITWNKDRLEKDNDSSTLVNLFSNSFSNYKESVLDTEIMYESFNRLNQGSLLAKSMNYVPHYEPYANGEILLHFFYPFIPRLIWPGKPITGGKQNMLRFTGIDNGDINSSNISPLGEAYVNFEASGGILFMLFYGLLFRCVYNKIFELTIEKPTLLLWVPSLFIASTASDTDVLSIWGTCATGIVFLFLFDKIVKRFGIYI